jgi:hypothetical protein
MNNQTSSEKPSTVVRFGNLALILFVVISLPVGVLAIILHFAVRLGILFSGPPPTPQAISLTYLPLPVVEITPMPRRDSLPERGVFNSQVELYTNRFGQQWTGGEEIRFYFYPERNMNIDQAGVFQEHRWRFSINFPWPTAPFSGELTQAIRGSVSVLLNPQEIDPDIRGPAVAEFVELLSDPQQMNLSNEGIRARCRYQVHGQVTLISISPVIGNFQFACQFDATEYALVSGWFWE